MALDQPPEEAIGSLAFPARLQQHVNDFAIGVNSTPQILLLILNFYEDLVDETVSP